ncbi:MAG: T9SS type A sorting domain-containing protein, partial [Candidatus Kapaibacterium sp.]
LLFEEGVDDTLSKFEIYRINKFNLSVDTLIIENEFTYLSGKTFEVNNKFYVAFSKQDSSVKNKYLLDNKITIFEYDIETNELVKVVDFEFNHKVELENVYYDKYTNSLYFYGNASTNKKTYADLTYSDYWIAEIDDNFNIKNEFSWSWSSLDRLQENVYNLNSDEEGLIISMGEYDITNSIPYKPYFFKMSRDLVTSIVETSDNSLFTVFPNPTSDFINLNTIALPYSIVLYDYTGKSVIEKSDIYDKDFRLDIREIPQGIYTLKVESIGVKQSKNVFITK